jgi:hypothetical protein
VTIYFKTNIKFFTSKVTKCEIVVSHQLLNFKNVLIKFVLTFTMLLYKSLFVCLRGSQTVACALPQGGHCWSSAGMSHFYEVIYF